MKAIRQKVFGADPYEGFDVNWTEPDLQGWGADHEIFATCIAEIRPKVIVELGSWKGASAIHMAQKCRDLGLETEIVCIDTWLGPSNVFLHGVNKLQPFRLASLRLTNGYPMLYYTFMRNVVDAGLQEMITPLPQIPENGAKTLAYHGVRADLICIDSPNAKNALHRELGVFWALLSPGGSMIGKDYDHPDIKSAVSAFAKKEKIKPEIVKGRYRLTKP